MVVIIKRTGETIIGEFPEPLEDAKGLIEELRRKMAENQKGGPIYDGLHGILEDARENEDVFAAEVPAYLTSEGQTAKQIAERFNKDYGSSVSEDKAKLILDSLVIGKTINEELKNGKIYYSLTF